MTVAAPEVTQARAARLAGALYLITMATAIFGESFVRGTLIVGDATQTAQNILQSESLFRFGMLTDLVTYAGVVVLIWALYILLRPISRNLALLALLLRTVEVAVHFATIFGSLAALRLLSGTGYLDAFEDGQLHALVKVALGTQGQGINLGFVPLGLGSAVFAYLLLKSSYVPRILAALGIVASLLLSTAAIVSIGFPAAARSLYVPLVVPMGIYEITLGFWLLIKGARIS